MDQSDKNSAYDIFGMIITILVIIIVLFMIGYKVSLELNAPDYNSCIEKIQYNIDVLNLDTNVISDKLNACDLLYGETK